MNNIQKLNRGFTIIEVVLVLAIAGLILLMVFIALPALQAGQRDTARKNDVSIVASAFNSATSNNRGATIDTAKLTPYLNNLSDNSPKADVKVSAAATGATATTDGAITVYRATKCGAISGSNVTLAAGTKTQYATVTKLEGGGGSAYCLDS